MRKILVLLLVLGLLVGTFATAEYVDKENFNQETFSFTEGFLAGSLGDPIPCNGGGDGGGGGQPG